MLILGSEDEGAAMDISHRDTVTKALRDITGVEHVRTDCYINSCIAYTANYNALTECPFCLEPRLDDRGKPRQTFDYVPIIHRLWLQYAHATRAETLKNYRKEMEDPWEEGINDYWDGKLHQQHMDNGFFGDEHDIALGFSTDGLQLFTVGTYSIWLLLLINLNLPPNQRVKKRNLILCSVIPGPNNPKDIQSFLRVMVDELKQLAFGIEDVYYASMKAKFTLHAHLCIVSSDLPAIAKVMGISGHNSYEYCRFCTVRGIHERHVYCPLRAPEGYPPESAFNHDPSNLPLRTCPFEPTRNTKRSH